VSPQLLEHRSVRGRVDDRAVGCTMDDPTVGIEGTRPPVAVVQMQPAQPHSARGVPKEPSTIQNPPTVRAELRIQELPTVQILGGRLGKIPQFRRSALEIR